MDEEVLKDAAVLGKKLAVKMKEKLGCDGVNLVQNNETCAGQTVFHFHLHVIPRYKEDGQVIGWTPGETNEKEQKEVLELLR